MENLLGKIEGALMSKSRNIALRKDRKIEAVAVANWSKSDFLLILVTFDNN